METRTKQISVNGHCLLSKRQMVQYKESASSHLLLFLSFQLQQRVVFHVISTQKIHGSEQITAVVHSHTFSDGRTELLQQRWLSGKLFPL